MQLSGAHGRGVRPASCWLPWKESSPAILVGTLARHEEHASAGAESARTALPDPWNPVVKLSLSGSTCNAALSLACSLSRSPESETAADESSGLWFVSPLPEHRATSPGPGATPHGSGQRHPVQVCAGLVVR